MHDEFAALRADFPALQQCTYLNLAGRGILSRTTRKALDEGLDQQMLGCVDKQHWKRMASEARRLFARTLHAGAEEVGCTKNVSEGLNAVATALPWRPGDNAVHCPGFDHPNATYAWWNLRRLGVELRPVGLLADGRLDLAALARALDRNTRMLALASVNFLTGVRAPLAEVGRLCRRRGVLLLVDGAQSTGVLDTDVRESCIDVWCASANKGLLGTYGVGFVYCRTEVAAALQPVYLSRFGVQVEDRPESEMGPQDFVLHPGARRFEVGNANWTGLLAVAASMRQWQSCPAAAIEAQALKMAGMLAEGLSAMGFAVPQAPERELRSHIVAVYGGRHADAGLERLDRALRARGVVFSRRLGAIRFGLHAYNDGSDVAQVLEAAREATQAG